MQSSACLHLWSPATSSDLRIVARNQRELLKLRTNAALMKLRKGVCCSASLDLAYQQAFTMSQLYARNRPKPVPLTEYQQKRKEKDMKEIMEAAVRRGRSPPEIREHLEQLDVLLPGLVNMHKMKASDWVTLADDVNSIARKLILLKTYYPKADIFKIVAQRPRTLLQSDIVIESNAQQVRQLLARAEDPDAIIEVLPELMDPASLSRTLGHLYQQFPDQDPVALIQRNPAMLLNMGESNVEDSAEYGELSTINF